MNSSFPVCGGLLPHFHQIPFCLPMRPESTKSRKDRASPIKAVPFDGVSTVALIVNFRQGSMHSRGQPGDAVFKIVIHQHRLAPRRCPMVNPCNSR